MDNSTLPVSKRETKPCVKPVASLNVTCECPAFVLSCRMRLPSSTASLSVALSMSQIYTTTYIYDVVYLLSRIKYATDEERDRAMIDTLKIVGKGALLTLLVIAVAMTLASNFSNAVDSEQAHQENMANAEARFMQQAIRHHTIPPDSRQAICDTRDNLIGYETFEKETVIFDDVKLTTATATCW